MVTGRQNQGTLRTSSGVRACHGTEYPTGYGKLKVLQAQRTCFVAEYLFRTGMWNLRMMAVYEQQYPVCVHVRFIFPGLLHFLLNKVDGSAFIISYRFSLAPAPPPPPPPPPHHHHHHRVSLLGREVSRRQFESFWWYTTGMLGRSPQLHFDS